MNALLIAVVSIVLTGLVSIAGFLIKRRFRDRKALGWEILSSVPVVIPLPKSHRQYISVRVINSMLGKDPDNEWTPIESFRTFLIRVQNTGDEVIDNLRVTFSLEQEAYIVSLEAMHTSHLGDLQVETEFQSPRRNFARATIPFLNARKEIVFSLQAVDSTSGFCRVTAGAPGLDVFSIAARRRSRRALTHTLILGFCSLILGGTVWWLLPDVIAGSVSLLSLAVGTVIILAAILVLSRLMSYDNYVKFVGKAEESDEVGITRY
jgi:hypothetical protein